MENGSYRFSYSWYGHEWYYKAYPYDSGISSWDIIFDASCKHPAVEKTLKRFRLHKIVQDMRERLYPNRPRHVAICDVSRDSRRERKPRKHGHTGVKDPNDRDLYANAWEDLV